MSSALTSQRFCLRWNNHQSNLLTVFDQLLHDESFVDVTLAVEGRFLRAHKMVLSACSPYFQALFVGHPDKHPIVILKDVPYCDMRSLLDFMYRGEVSVDQERLTAFLKVAESLRIKGLTEVNEDRCDLPTITSSLLSTAAHTPPPPAPPPPPHLHRIHPTGHKRSAPPASAANPLLGSALTAPKRKRGRPRKLSGSSPGPGAPPSLLPAAPAPAAAALAGAGLSDAAGQQARGPATLPLDANDLDAHRLGAGENIVVQGSPEMLEVKMGALDFQQNSPPPAPIASSTPCGSRGGGSSRTEAENGRASPDLPRGLSGKEVKIKEEPEPTPGPSSQDSEQGFGQSNSEQEQQAFALDSLGLLPKSKLQSANAGGSSGGRGGGSGASSSGAPPGPGGGGGGGGGGGSSGSGSGTAQQPEGNARGGGGASSSGAGEPGAPAPASAPASRPPPVKRRARRRATSAGQDPAEALTEMSVRGLNLFRYASVSEGVYRCTECAKADVQKTFKNKYSFQRHAFLYHEGHQRKVFPCPVCTKEFSRPDKMKNHMKTVHDCFMPKDCGFPLGFFTSFP